MLVNYLKAYFETVTETRNPDLFKVGIFFVWREKRKGFACPLN